MDSKRYSRAGRNQRRQPYADGADPMQTVWGLIALNVLVFVVWHVLDGNPLQQAFRMEMVVARGTVLYHPWTLLTYAFTHYDTNHLLFNMFGLWMFGRTLLGRYGTRGVMVLYVGGALCGGLAHVLGSQAPALGASASVMAVATAWAATFPNQEIRLWFFIPMKAWVFGALFVTMDVLGMVGPGDGIAHLAHLGGAGFGLGYWYWSNR
jgi:membrane associated rhomboid family serine protease